MNGITSAMAAMAAIARGAENDWVPSPLAATKTIAKTAPQAAPSREIVGWFISCASLRWLRGFRR